LGTVTVAVRALLRFVLASTPTHDVVYVRPVLT
jgi:hypothetical protein